MPHTESVMGVKDSKVSIAVVGAGVVGLCTALEAQRKGYQVTLFDRDEPGLGASFGNAGYLATELIEPLSNPQTLMSAIALWLNPNGPLSLPLPYLHRITPWLVRFILAAKPRPHADSRKGLMQLNKTAVAAWKRCLDDIGASEQIVKSGYMLVWESSSKRHEALQHQRWLSENGIAGALEACIVLASTVQTKCSPFCSKIAKVDTSKRVVFELLSRVIFRLAFMPGNILRYSIGLFAEIVTF